MDEEKKKRLQAMLLALLREIIGDAFAAVIAAAILKLLGLG